MASVCHALGRGAVPCRAGARRRALLLRVQSAGGAEPLCVAWWGPLTIVEAARAGTGGGVEGARVQRVRRADACSAMCWWALLSTSVYRLLSASCDTG